jgi:hypothetical protein
MVALSPGRKAQFLKGPITTGLFTTLGVALVLILYFNLVNPHPTPMQFRLLILVALFAVALGLLRYLMLRRSWEGLRAPAEIAATLLSLPLTLGIGFLFIWGQNFRPAMASDPRSLLWNLAAVAVLALVCSLGLPFRPDPRGALAWSRSAVLISPALRRSRRRHRFESPPISAGSSEPFAGSCPEHRPLRADAVRTELSAPLTPQSGFSPSIRWFSPCLLPPRGHCPPSPR